MLISYYWELIVLGCYLLFILDSVADVTDLSPRPSIYSKSSLVNSKGISFLRTGLSDINLRRSSSLHAPIKPLPDQPSPPVQGPSWAASAADSMQPEPPVRCTPVDELTAITGQAFMTITVTFNESST